MSHAQAADRAVRAVPPVWPLASSVAVNPFLGQAGEPLAQAAARLGRVAGVAITMPRDWYQARIDSGAILDEDLAAAWAAAPAAARPASLAALKAALRTPSPLPQAVPNVAELAATATGIDWPALIAERVGAWAAGYFDEGQALWAAPRGRGAYSAWRAVSTHDLTPEIMGLAGFATTVSEAPETAADAIMQTSARLGLPDDALDSYFHRLLMTLGGWSHVGRYKLWQAELAGETDDTATDLLAIRLVWEAALFERYGTQIGAGWSAAIAQHAEPVAAGADHIIDSILQEAAEQAAQRELAATLASATRQGPARRPAMQAAFCIDVRSEVFRRALEATDPDIRTLGFAGFFGLGTSHRRFASSVREHRLPVLMNAGLRTCSGGPAEEAADQSARFRARAKRAWGRFKLAAVSSFAFVEATGPVYAGKLLAATLGVTGPAARPDPAPRPEDGLDLPARIDAAEAVLRAMSLTMGMARLVLVVGHGANVVNNPHASGLHCGACGGYSGEVNARLLAGLLSDPQVREGLALRGIEIPADTLFLAGLHDTTTDAVRLYQDGEQASHAADIAQAALWLQAAGTIARTERALLLPGATSPRSVAARSRDWSQTRPEWGLAGCRAFIAAPRSRTAGKSLQGRAFLHDYDWSIDRGFGVLELIMTAPVVVASWISLQYYGSAVAPAAFGGGNKLLHNVVGGMGVAEGNGGLLRAGLPWQSVHDGQRLMHEPLRLSVCIEAPRAAISDILERHPGVRALFDNRWMHLFALDAEGRMAWRYEGDLRWAPMADQLELAA